MEIESILRELSELLYGLNYQVYLGLYKVPYRPGASAKQYIAEALGPPAEVEWCRPVTGQEVFAEVESYLCYAGSDGHGPHLAALGSDKFKELLKCVRSHIEQTVSAATIIEQFLLDDPWSRPEFYPVHWHFAFVIAGPLGAEVFIGACSD